MAQSFRVEGHFSVQGLEFIVGRGAVVSGRKWGLMALFATNPEWCWTSFPLLFRKLKNNGSVQEFGHREGLSTSTMKPWQRNCWRNVIHWLLNYLLLGAVSFLALNTKKPPARKAGKPSIARHHQLIRTLQCRTLVQARVGLRCLLRAWNPETHYSCVSPCVETGRRIQSSGTCHNV